MLLGVGQVRVGGKMLAATEGLARAGLAPCTLGAKEGLALINGTQVSTALALAGLFGAEDVLAAAVVAGAMSVDALKASDAPFDERIHEIRGQPGQIAVAREYRALTRGSAHPRLASRLHARAGSLLLPLPAAGHGRVSRLHAPVRRDACASRPTPSPTIRCCSIGGDVLSGGNFHAEPVAFAADTLALAIAEIGNLSERRIAVLVDPKMSGLPAFLVQNSGLNSGLHDRAGDGGRTGRGEQGAGGSLQRRLHPDLRESGRPRQHGHSCRAAPGAP